MNNSNYGYSKKISFDFNQAIIKTKEALKLEGFSIVAEIDFQDILHKKINAEMDYYTILEACHPPSAYQSILSEIEIGLMLPCNIVLYQKNNEVFVSAIKPSVAMGMIENRALNEVASGVEKRLFKVIDNL